MKLRLTLIALLSSVVQITFANEYKSLQTCIDLIESDYPGQIVSMEVESEGGDISYEFDINSNINGTDFFIEIECDAINHQLGEFQLETNADDKDFQSKTKISVSEAEKIAQKKYSGEVVTREYGFAKGRPFYSFDIYNQNKNVQTEITIDAISGSIISEEEELYQIGLDRTF